MYNIKEEQEKETKFEEPKDTNKTAKKALFISIGLMVLAVVLIIVLCFIKV